MNRSFASLAFVLVLAVPLDACAGKPSEQAAAPADPYADLLPNARQPLPDVVVGGQPSLEQLDEASRLGFATVINLRLPGESPIGAAAVEERGMRYVALPIAGAEDLDEAHADSFRRALEEAERPVIVHCGSGNRVGALFALDAFYNEGIDVEEALAFGENAGLTRLEPAVREVLTTDDD